MMTRYDLEFLESMIVKPCNLSCQGCTTYSDLKWSGYVPWEQGRAELEPWIKRLNIGAWGAVGGEPLMNPDLKNWLIGVRELLPQSQIRLVTNGTLLNRHRDIIKLMHELGNCTLKISYHIQDRAVDDIIQDIMAAYAWQPVTEYGIDRWLTDRGFRFQIARPKQFFRTFLGTYDDMRPHDNDPRLAFDLCVQKRCPMLLDGLIYKCGTAALTRGVLERFNNPNLDLWQPYLGTGLDPECADSELEKFVKNFGKPHPMCRQCPTSKDTHSILDHTITVTRK